MKKLISIDYGNTLYREMGSPLELGGLNASKSDTNLQTTGLGVLQLFNLMRSGKIVLLNSGCYDGRALAQFLCDINYIYELSLQNSVPFGNSEEILNLLQNNLYISTFSGCKIVKFKFQDTLEQQIVLEKTIQIDSFLSNLKNTQGIKSIHLQKGDEAEKFMPQDFDKVKNRVAHTLSIKFDNETALRQFKQSFNQENIMILDEFERYNVLNFSQKSSKESAIIDLANMLSINLDECIHFGDSTEDICSKIDYKILENSTNKSKKNTDLLEYELAKL